MNALTFTSYLFAHTYGLLIILNIILFVYVVYLHRKVSLFTRGADGKSLESTIQTYLNHVDTLRAHDEMIAEHALKLDKRVAQSIRNVSALRFKAFDQNSSNQSFAIALVNELGNGVILSSLHHRDRVSIFAKPVSQYTSEHDLSEEEQSVRKEAKTSHSS